MRSELLLVWLTLLLPLLSVLIEGAAAAVMVEAGNPLKQMHQVEAMEMKVLWNK